jgi:FMN reductase
MTCRAVSFLIISASLNPESNSRTLALAAVEALRGVGRNAELLDLREPEFAALPMCDGASAYAHPALDGLNARIMGAEGVLIAAPIYNYDVNAALKNLVELTGSSWEDQTVGFICAAGGQASYMSIMAFANSLMLDFRCVIVPRFVYATSRDFSEDGQPAPAIAKRVVELAEALVRLSAAKKE